MHCEIIINIKLINTSIMSHGYLFFPPMVRTVKIYSVSKFKVYSTVLFTIVIRPNIRSSELIVFITECLYPLISIFHFSKPLATTLLLSVTMSLTFFVFFKIPQTSYTIQYLSFSGLFHLA